MMRFYVVTNEVRRAEFMSEIKPGIYRNVKITDYHSGDGLSATGPCELMRSPLHYITSLKTPHKETPVLKLGSAHIAQYLNQNVSQESTLRLEILTAELRKERRLGWKSNSQEKSFLRLKNMTK